MAMFFMAVLSRIFGIVLLPVLKADYLLSSFPYPQWLVFTSLFLTNLGSTIPVSIAAIILSLKSRRPEVPASFLLLFALTLSLKIAVGRERPPNPFISDSMSFPSNHAAFSMLVALWAGRVFEEKRRGWLFMLYPFAIGATRVIMKVHYFSDVVAGWVIGATVFLCFSSALRKEG